MNVVFVGASQFGLRCLREIVLLESINVVGVVTAPKKFKISYRPEGVDNVLYADVASFAERCAIPCETIPENQPMSSSRLLEVVSGWAPDCFLVAGWYHMITKTWREIAPAYGLHASLLPNYSGGAPLVWALINGEKETGITLFQMDDGVDTGPIVSQRREQIFSDDTIATLYARIEDRGIELIREQLPKIASGTHKLTEQSLSNRVEMPQRSPDDGLIDWNGTSADIDRFIRAQTRPYPGAFSVLRGGRLIIWAAERVADPSYTSSPGVVTADEAGFCCVACGDLAIKLLSVEWEGTVYDGVSISEVLVGVDSLVA